VSGNKVAVSLFLYVKIMGSMSQPVMTGQEALFGQTGRVGAEGTVKVDGERWKIARPDGLVPGQRVRIVGLRGMQVQVQPVEQDR
jgi:membrane-bound serine protease (ClpP class)